MKTISPERKRRGTALLIILGVLFLMTVLVVGFFDTVRHDNVSSNAYANGISLRQLTDLANGLVMTQISEATKDGELAWISQPGLIRTFDPNGQRAAYKLFSSDALVGDGNYNPLTASEIPSRWYDQADSENQFFDLNRPVKLNNTTKVYPIVDPAADPAAHPGSTADVEGFKNNATVEVAPPPGHKFENEIPMPVRWIYILDDGSLANWNQVRGSRNSPTSPQPVGRIAFWADDESCKVNINTASDGVFYDYPVANTRQDHILGRTQPTAQEYQRWPGHPSTTSLSAVFKELRNIAATGPVANGAPNRSEKAAEITPRIAWGGSRGGKDAAWYLKNPVIPDSDRLYASVDELAFGRTGDGLSGDNWFNGDKRPLSLISEDTLAKTRFFLTANSRAPELNIFNRPRITIWPFNANLLGDTSKLTPEDRLIKFASEIAPPGGQTQRFYFQRDKAWDARWDYDSIQDNKNLYTYLQNLTERGIPGNRDRTGGGETFKDKYTELGRDQILTEIFDYTRSLVNTINFAYKPVNGPTYSFPNNHTTDQGGFSDTPPFMIDAGNGLTKGFGKSAVLNEVILQFYCMADDEETAGPDTITWEFDKDTGRYKKTNVPDGIRDYRTVKVQMVMLMDFFGTVDFLSRAMPRLQVKVSGGTPFQYVPYDPAPEPPSVPRGVYAGLPGFVMQQRPEGGTFGPGAVDMKFPDSGLTNLICSDYRSTHQNGGRFGLMWPLLYPASAPNSKGRHRDDRNYGKALRRTPGYEYYPFYGEPVEFQVPNLPPHPTSPYKPNFKVKVTGAPVRIQIFPALAEGTSSLASMQDPEADLSNCLTDTTINFQDVVIPLPRLAPSTAVLSGGQITVRSGTIGDLPGLPPTFRDFKTYSNRLLSASMDDVMLVPREDYSVLKSDKPPMDVFRSYALRGTAEPMGDLRLAAARRDVPSSWWEPTPMYFNPEAFHGCTVFRKQTNGGGRGNLQYPVAYLTDTNNTGVLGYNGDEVVEVGAGAGQKSAANDPRNDAFNAMVNNFMANLFPNKALSNSMYSRNASASTNGASRHGAVVGDFTSGYGRKPDGAFILGPDTGSVGDSSEGISTDGNDGKSPYFANLTDVSTTSTLMGNMFAPFKQMPSPVMFGTLPSRVFDIAGGSWETLLFCPNPSGGRNTHRGWTELPRDHYLLDLFYMPVVEPYAMTENFSTAGKINLNYQIAPFTYINRSTGIHALLRNQQIMAVPESIASTYKVTEAERIRTASNDLLRKPLDVKETLAGFEQRFAANDPFVSPSEICEMFLVPQNFALGGIESFWDSNKLTSDDKREMPYNHVYPRVTTRSNTFQVHYCVQSLKTSFNNGNAVYNVTGQFRGSSIIERYLNLSEMTFSSVRDFPALAGINPNTRQPYYRFRVMNNKQFSP